MVLSYLKSRNVDNRRCRSLSDQYSAKEWSKIIGITRLSFLSCIRYTIYFKSMYEIGIKKNKLELLKHNEKRNKKKDKGIYTLAT